MDTRRDGHRAVGTQQVAPRLLRWWHGGVVAVVTAALAGTVLSACGGPAGAPGGALGDLEWPERQVVFRLVAQPLRLEAYSIRGGVAPLGSVPLSLDCPQAMALDESGGRMWVWGAQGGVAVDSRSLRVVGQWGSNAEDAVLMADVVRRGLAVTRVRGVCGTGVALVRTEKGSLP